MDIVTAEGRTAVAAMKHVARNTSNFDKEVLIIGDYVSAILGASKGRSSAPALNSSLRAIGA